MRYSNDRLFELLLGDLKSKANLTKFNKLRIEDDPVLSRIEEPPDSRRMGDGIFPSTAPGQIAAPVKPWYRHFKVISKRVGVKFNAKLLSSKHPIGCHCSFSLHIQDIWTIGFELVGWGDQVVSSFRNMDKHRFRSTFHTRGSVDGVTNDTPMRIHFT
jgi:hypothetical protein